jgi:hypothetical protein
MNPNKKTARLAGLCFLLMVVFGLGAELFFRQKLFVPNDLASTINNITANVSLYRLGIVSDMLMALFYLFTAVTLYKLLISVNKGLAALMVIFAAAGSVLLLFNILNELAPLYILTGEGYAGALDPMLRQSLALTFFGLYEHGYMIGQVFFALWVLPLGMLIYRSGAIPKFLGILFIVETICGLAAVFVHFILSNTSVETVLLCPGTAAELLFMFWLLIWGVKKSKMTAPVSEK